MARVKIDPTKHSDTIRKKPGDEEKNMKITALTSEICPNLSRSFDKWGRGEEIDKGGNILRATHSMVISREKFRTVKRNADSDLKSHKIFSSHLFT
jgi:hypothetical protein